MSPDPYTHEVRGVHGRPFKVSSHGNFVRVGRTLDPTLSVASAVEAAGALIRASMESALTYTVHGVTDEEIVRYLLKGAGVSDPYQKVDTGGLLAVIRGTSADEH